MSNPSCDYPFGKCGGKMTSSGSAGRGLPRVLSVVHPFIQTIGASPQIDVSAASYAENDELKPF
jgi:hypothetical protein